jgi:hypothetical protein
MSCGYLDAATGEQSAVFVTGRRIGSGARMLGVCGLVASLTLHALFVTAALWPARMRVGTAAPPPEPPPMLVFDLPGGKKGVLLETQDRAPECLQ